MSNINAKKIAYKEINLSPNIELAYIDTYPNQSLLPKNQTNNENKFFTIKENKKYGIMDNKMNIIIPPKYDDDFSLYYNKFFGFGWSEKGTYYSMKGKKFNFTAETNADIQSSKYPNTIISVKDNKYGVIDTEGNIIIPFIYQSILNIDGNKFIVQKF